MRKISNKQPNLTPKANRERRTKKHKVSRRKEIIKIRSEINEKEMKEIKWENGRMLSNDS